MKGSLITTTKDDATGLTYGIYLIRYTDKLWIATYDMDHDIIVQMQKVTMSEDRIPEHVRKAVVTWLL